MGVQGSPRGYDLRGANAPRFGYISNGGRQNKPEIFLVCLRWEEALPQ
jgi:hypothetical protein